MDQSWIWIANGLHPHRTCHLHQLVNFKSSIKLKTSKKKNRQIEWSLAQFSYNVNKLSRIRFRIQEKLINSKCKKIVNLNRDKISRICFKIQEKSRKINVLKKSSN